MPNIKALDMISRKWARVAAASQEEYEQGVRNPRTDWAKATTDANNAYKAGISQALSEDRFAKGVAKAGTRKWQENAIAKGPRRWAEGIGLSEGAYEAGFAPYRQVISGITLPPRGPKGDPNNIRRVSIIAKALHEKKLQLKGAS